MTVKTLGIDLAKNVCHLIGLDAAGKLVLRRRVSRAQLLRLTVRLERCVIGMEPCCGAHHLGRRLAGQGHDVRLIPAQFVRPFVKSNKNDYLDAEAIAEAVQRPRMRFVPLKSVEQLDLQALDRVRDRLVGRRTGVINQLRAFLLERGIAPRQGRLHLKRLLPGVLEDAEAALSLRMRTLLDRLWQEWRRLEEEIESLTKEIRRIANENADCRRLMQIPGIGPWWRQAWWRRPVPGRDSRAAATWRLGLGSYRGNTPPEGNQSCSPSASAATPTCAACFCTAPAPHACAPNGNATASANGSTPSNGALTTTLRRPRWPTSWPASPGPCSPGRRITGRAAPLRRRR